ncbi:acetolactate synthase-1/2/3 large subunit [Ancylobacter sp. 3268]|uniref:thiamine pyrophosphate-dependent enzyme n=1 Tax=Ancylobacter sp. 3268 TaxID=2817752 RepID=UPI00285B463E|nr:thiamine pyrophosphate-dependent enzyme [Ancylobacter sp. 3268]MDR6955340.1 acetolactate synthase-1/2/3 large subunit [Ancylobacter sp. 3268]
MTARMTGGEAVVDALKANGVETLYAIPGIQLDHLFNALHGVQNWLTIVNARHEQGVAYMALGHAQSTGEPGVYVCVPGPGFLNTAAALSTAYAVRAPVLALIGQIASTAIGVGGGELHELPDQTAIVKGLTRWNGIARTPEEIPALMETAFAKLKAGIAPVAVELPADVLKAAAELPPARPAVAAPPRAPIPHAVTRAAALLAQAKAPLIVVGSGAYGGEAALTRLAEHLEAPVVAHLQGRGVLPSTHPLAVGFAEGQKLWAEADVVLAIGTRFHEARRNWGERAGLRVIRVDTDPAQFSRGLPPEIAMEADAPLTLATLGEAVAAGPAKSGRAETIAALKTEIAQAFATRLAPQMAYVRALRTVLPADARIVADYTQIGYVSTAAFDVAAPRLLLTPGYQGTLGFAYATALGAKSANPEVPVVALCGDGGFLFTGNELATAVQHGIAAIGVVFVDGAYGNVRRMQEELYGGKVVATGLTNPDFVRYAESFGARARRAEGPEAFAAALEWAMAETGPTLIEVPVATFPDPWDLLEP